MRRITKVNTGRRTLKLRLERERLPRSIAARVLLFSIALAGSTGMSAPALAYDMDCKVILCLAGGFPSGCGDARSYMIRRLKKTKPPFGPCSGGSDDGGTYDVPVRMFIRKILPKCTSWAEDRDGRYCAARIPGREEGVIGFTIPQDEGLPDYYNDYVWWSRSWDPSEDRK